MSNEEFVPESPQGKFLYPSDDDTNDASPVLQPTVLRGVVAFVEIFNEGKSISSNSAIKSKLEHLGAKIVSKLQNGVTHVIFKDGAVKTFDKAVEMDIPVVTPLWLQSCVESGKKKDIEGFEAERPGATDTKRRKSMEPKQPVIVPVTHPSFSSSQRPDDEVPVPLKGRTSTTTARKSASFASPVIPDSPILGVAEPKEKESQNIMDGSEEFCLTGPAGVQPPAMLTLDSSDDEEDGEEKDGEDTGELSDAFDDIPHFPVRHLPPPRRQEEEENGDKEGQQAEISASAELIQESPIKPVKEKSKKTATTADTKPKKTAAVAKKEAAKKAEKEATKKPVEKKEVVSKTKPKAEKKTKQTVDTESAGTETAEEKKKGKADQPKVQEEEKAKTTTTTTTTGEQVVPKKPKRLLREAAALGDIQATGHDGRRGRGATTTTAPASVVAVVEDETASKEKPTKVKDTPAKKKTATEKKKEGEGSEKKATGGKRKAEPTAEDEKKPQKSEEKKKNVLSLSDSEDESLATVAVEIAESNETETKKKTTVPATKKAKALSVTVDETQQPQTIEQVPETPDIETPKKKRSASASATKKTTAETAKKHTASDKDTSATENDENDDGGLATTTTTTTAQAEKEAQEEKERKRKEKSTGKRKAETADVTDAAAKKASKADESVTAGEKKTPKKAKSTKEEPTDVVKAETKSKKTEADSGETSETKKQPKKTKGIKSGSETVDEEKENDTSRVKTPSKSKRKAHSDPTVEDESQISVEASVVIKERAHPAKVAKETKEAKTLAKRSTNTIKICDTSSKGALHDVVVRTVQSLGGSLAEAAHCTHLVVGDGRRTMKVLEALATGAWLVKAEWVYRSLEADQWLDPQDYLSESFSGAKKCKNGSLLKDVSCYVSQSVTSASDVQNLVKLAGGTVSSTVAGAQYCLTGSVPSKRVENVYYVIPSWLFDSLSAYKLADATTYDPKA